MHDAPPEDETGLALRSLRVAISVFAVFGYALAFGAAAAGVAHLLGHARSLTGLDTTVALRVGGAGALLIPAAAFLFVALYDDATLTRPVWTDGHPPLVEAWLAAIGAAGFVAVALSGPEGQFPLWELGWFAAGAVAYVALPLWFARRCLRRPSWLLGGLSLLLAPVVAVGAVLATVALPVDEPAIGAVVAVVGTAVPYGLAAASPGPERLAATTAEVSLRWARAVGRWAGAVRTAARRE